MANENLGAPGSATDPFTLTPTPAENTAVTAGTQITAAKFRSLIDTIDVYLQHRHTFADEYRSNCQCQCGRGSI